MLHPRRRHALASAALLAVLPIAALAAPPAAGPAKVAPTGAGTVPVPAVCFAPGTPETRMRDVRLRAAGMLFATSLGGGPESFNFDDGSRWSATATDGAGLGQGDPTTLTWSIVPDGTPIFGFIGEPSGPSNLRTFLNGIYGSEAVWLPVFERVFARWGELTGTTYVYEPNDDGDPWTGTIAGGRLGVRGDVRIAGHRIDGNFGVLAYNFFPNFGDMVIDTGDGFYNDTRNDSLGLRNTLAHEHGHGLGLEHVCPRNGTKLMEPILNLGFDGPQHDDTLAAQRGYGDRFEHNDGGASATDLGSLGDGTVALAEVSVDDNTDRDLYRFTVAGGGSLDATVAPVGSTYPSGPQVGNCTSGDPFNSLAIHDLGLEVLDAAFAPLGSADANPAGQGESLSGLGLPAAGDYLVRVTGDTTNAAQLYRLDLTLSGVGAGGQIFADGFESGDTAAWSESFP